MKRTPRLLVALKGMGLLGGVLTLILAACATATVAPLVSSPIPLVTPTSEPTSLATLVPQLFDLVVMHTNDVLGYTEPCG